MTMKARLARAAIAPVAITLCAVAATRLPPLWQGVSGRDFRPSATMVAFLIFTLAILMRAGFRWAPLDFILGVLPVEVMTLLGIAFFSGYTWFGIFDSFNLLWLGWLNLYLGLPWLAGPLLGSVWLKARG